MALSIIIPTLNEESALLHTLKCLSALSPAPLEILVADAGSTDSTVSIAKDAGIRVLKDLPTGRAGQMNAGAAAAVGDQLCFLHADTNVPEDFAALADGVLHDEATALAGFISVMRGPDGVRRVTTAHNFLKTWYAPLLFRPLSFFRGCRLLFGDQVMICRRADFEAVGGFDPGQTIMEEADLCLRMVREGRGRVRQVNRKVWSSDRRVAEWGFWKANATYLYVGMMWGFGAGPKRLSQHYKDVR
ncbi:MAG: glycosyltransferase [Pseudomonadota bacterium]